MNEDWPFDPLHVFGYDLIVIDPPWDVSEVGHEFQNRAPRHPMSFKELAKLPVGHLARRDCLILTWGSAPLIHKQIEVVEKWGAVYRSKMEWSIPWRMRKPKGQVRVYNPTECILVATIGNPKHSALPGLMSYGQREYPRKPEEFYTMLNERCPDLKLRADVFTMKGKKGWDKWRPRHEKPEMPPLLESEYLLVS